VKDVVSFKVFNVAVAVGTTVSWKKEKARPFIP
jgi:hypothetical protein